MVACFGAGISCGQGSRDATDLDVHELDVRGFEAGDIGALDTGRDAAVEVRVGSEPSSDAGNEVRVSGGDVIVDVGQTNPCGGTGPLLWRGKVALLDEGCGPCSLGHFMCGSPDALVCTPPQGTTACPDAGAFDACEIPASAYSAMARARPTPPDEMPPTETKMSTISLDANNLVYNPFDFHLYASIYGASVGGNSIAVIDPSTATITNSIYVGGEPTKMALSDDGQVLWVILDKAATVRRVDLRTGTAGLEFGLGAWSNPSPWYARDLAVLPGTHDSVLVTRNGKPSTATGGAVLYDAGIPRDYATPLFAPTISELVATYAPQLIFGQNGVDSGAEFTTICANSNGLFWKEQSRVDWTNEATKFAFAQNVIYTNYGRAYDIAARRVLGTYPSTGAVAPDPGARRVFFLANQGEPVVSAYDMDTFSPAGSEKLPMGTGYQRDLVRWGRFGYAFTGRQVLVIVQSKLVPAAP
jgi:YVTN family beta-propeller protein